MLTTKPGVRFAVITPALLYMLTAVERLSRGMGLPHGLVITSGSDGTHMAGSKHYTGEAIDLRSKNFRNGVVRAAFMGSLEQLLGPQFHVEIEDVGTVNEHFHIQVRKGHRFDETKP